jgi:hypothetical protein
MTPEMKALEPKQYISETVPIYLSNIRAYPNIVWIYRGQANGAWPLLPKSGRPEYFNPKWKETHETRGFQPQDLGRFKEWRSKAVAYCPALPENDWECLAYAQHYGLATRFLDWTTNSLVALYFAAETHPEEDGAVFCYIPWICVEPYHKPIAFQKVPQIVKYKPRPFDRRILVQAGCFTYHPEPEKPISAGKPHEDAIIAAQDGVNLVTFIISAKAKKTILWELSDIGISRESLFPDLEGLSFSVNWETKRSLKD